jgi:hypothetical protein
MRNLTDNLWNSTRGSNLYCVWVPVHDDGGDRLISIWIDPVQSAFRPQMEGKMHEVCRVVVTCPEREQEFRDHFETEALNFIRTHCNERTERNERTQWRGKYLRFARLSRFLLGAVIGAEPNVASGSTNRKEERGLKKHLSNDDTPDSACRMSQEARYGGVRGPILF